MGSFFLGITLLGFIIWTSSFGPTDNDKKLHDSYYQKKNRDEIPTNEELWVHRTHQFLEFGKVLTIFGIIGFIGYLIFQGLIHV